MTSAVIVLTEAAFEAVIRAAPGVRTELIPNPVAIDDSAGSAADTAELVVFAGEVGVRKGADVLARAWTEVSIRRPLARCIMVGPETGLDLPACERLEVLGPMSREEVGRLIRRARVIALPSRGEALPMILVEAIAAARPFVSTAVGGVESLAAGGVLVPVDDYSALADALVAFLGDSEYARAVGVKGQQFCRSNVALEVIDGRLRRLYAHAARANESRVLPIDVS
jgi:hypothetical protein